MITKGYETENGFLGVELKKDEGKIEVDYLGTKEMKIGTIISILGLAAAVVLSIKKYI